MGREHGALTWEMTSLKDDLNSCTSVVNRLTSCPVFLASKKAMSCLAVGPGATVGEREKRYFRIRPHLQTFTGTPGGPIGHSYPQSPLQLAIPEQVAEEGPPHVQSHALANAGQEHQVPKGQQSLGEKQGHSGAPRRLFRLPGPLLLPYLEAVEEEQVGAETPGLFQEVAHVVPRVLGHNLHQLAQE